MFKLALLTILLSVLVQSYAKHDNKTSDIIPEERCYGGGGYGGGGYRNGGGGGGGYPVYIPVPVNTGGAGNAGTGTVTGVQPLSDGSYLLYCGNVVCGRTAPGANVG